MLLLTFSVFKKFKLKSIISYKFYRNFSNECELTVDKYADPKLIEILPTWQVDQEPVLRVQVLQDMKVVPDFISEKEETSLIEELEPRLRRMRYEFDHWDNAIEGYRETERDKWTAENEEVVRRVRSVAFAPTDAPLDHVHVLDLAAAGHIKPHVDAVRFCGDVIAGISLMSPAVMRLQHTQKAHLVLDALLPRRSLYIMRGVARYEFTHAVLGGGDSTWRGERVRRARRLAIISRARPHPQHT